MQRERLPCQWYTRWHWAIVSRTLSLRKELRFVSAAERNLDQPDFHWLCQTPWMTQFVETPTVSYVPSNASATATCSAGEIQSPTMSIFFSFFSNATVKKGLFETWYISTLNSGRVVLSLVSGVKGIEEKCVQVLLNWCLWVISSDVFYVCNLLTDKGFQQVRIISCWYKEIVLNPVFIEDKDSS